jgi:hypothetical protein
MDSEAGSADGSRVRGSSGWARLRGELPAGAAPIARSSTHLGDDIFAINLLADISLYPVTIGARRTDAMSPPPRTSAGSADDRERVPMDPHRALADGGLDRMGRAVIEHDVPAPVDLVGHRMAPRQFGVSLASQLSQGRADPASQPVAVDPPAPPLLPQRGGQASTLRMGPLPCPCGAFPEADHAFSWGARTRSL